MYGTLLLACAAFVHLTAAEGFIIVASPDDFCPGDFNGKPNCLTLDQFLSNYSHVSDLTLNLHPGKHELNNHNFELQGMESFVLRATGEVSFDCMNNFVVMENITQVHINGIKFVNCTRAIKINSVNQFTLVNSSLGGSSSQKLWIRDIHHAIITNSRFSDSALILDVQNTPIVTISKCIFSNNNIALSSVNSFVTINQSVFSKNRAEDIESLEFGAAIFLVVYLNISLHESFPQEKALIIINSTFEGNTARQYGGAVFAFNANVTVIGSRFVNNTAQKQGGAMFTHSNRDTNQAKITIDSSKFIGNKARYDGGAIYTYATGSVQASHSSFVGNTASLGGGGAIFTDRCITVANSIFMSNSAAYCGVLDILECNHQVKVNSSLFSFNTATGELGGKFQFNARNWPGNGGVICVRDITISILNGIFIQNSATDLGGVMYATNSTVLVGLDQCIIIANTVGIGGGVIYKEQNGTRLEITESLFVGNKALDGRGGVLYNRGTSCLQDQVSISGTSFHANSAAIYGEVIYSRR